MILKKIRENKVYCRFKTKDERIVRLLTANAINNIPLKAIIDTFVTVKVIDKKEIDPITGTG